SPMTSLKTSIKTITYLSDTGCLEIQGASLKWMQDQASTHGLLGHPALTQPIKNILLEEAKRENLAITLENGPDNTLTIHPVTAPLENVSRWLTTAQVTYGIVIEDLQFTLAGNEEITLRHLSFREQQ
ncbi:type II secretion system protein GspM, partial [Escherichia coli]